MKKFLKFIIWLITVAYIFFIFSNSIQNGTTSSAISGNITIKILNILKQYDIYIAKETLHRFLRKFAHFSEFFVLGFLVSIAITTFPLIKSRIFNFIIFLLFVPLTDEIIQYFTPDRVSSYKDILIDSFGMVMGGFVVYIIYLIIKDLFFKKSKN